MGSGHSPFSYVMISMLYMTFTLYVASLVKPSNLLTPFPAPLNCYQGHATDGHIRATVPYNRDLHSRISA